MKIEGILRREDLFERGYTRAGIERAVNEGQIKRIAHGWYAQPWANRDVVRALEFGGRLGCLSGCRFWGLWVPEDHELHVVFPSWKVAEGAVRKIQVCGHVRSEQVTDGRVWPLLECLDHVVRFHDAETALVVIESAMHEGFITSDDAVVLLADHVRKGARLTKHLDVAESGSETRVRLFLSLNPPVWFCVDCLEDLCDGLPDGGIRLDCQGDTGTSGACCVGDLMCVVG